MKDEALTDLLQHREETMIKSDQSDNFLRNFDVTPNVILYHSGHDHAHAAAAAADDDEDDKHVKLKQVVVGDFGHF